MQYNNIKLKKAGFTLTEMVVGAAVFAIIAAAVFQSYSGFVNLVAMGKHKITAADIINEEFELIRNLPYADVGLVYGIPKGVLGTTTSITRNGSTFHITRTIRNIDDPFDGTLGGTPNDLSPSDSKLVQIDIECSNCKNFVPVSAVSRVAPKNLETASTNGALFIRVLDANGNNLPQADVHVEYIGTTTPIIIDDETNNQGLLQIVDAPPGTNTYRIIATKPGYTTDRTYASSGSIQNPVSPDATVLLQQVTVTSFIIDRTSSLTIETLNNTCTPIAQIPFRLTGGKLIGTSPDVLKFDTSRTTDSTGTFIFPDLEWDTFTLTAGDGGLYLAGTNPVLPFSILPNSAQTMHLVMTDASPAHLLTTVTDSATGLPISNAILSLSGNGFSETRESGRGYLEQTDWSGGAGASDYTDETRFFSTDGNLAIQSPPGDVKLLTSLGEFVPYGEIISSIFDTGTSSNFGNIFWSPTAQPPETGSSPVKFQIATAPLNTATTTWNYLGPDGTNSSFYTVSNTNIAGVHNGDRYIRYKMILETEDENMSPTIAHVAFTFTSACIPPGQAIFSGLQNGSYTLEVAKSGYDSETIPITVSADWQNQYVSLSSQ